MSILGEATVVRVEFFVGQLENWSEISGTRVIVHGMCILVLLFFRVKQDVMFPRN